MRIQIILSGQKDIDLLMLAENPYFNIKKAIVDSLEAYIRGERIMIPIPDYSINPNMDLKTKRITFSITEQRRPEVYKFLQQIQEGYVTICIKAILRTFLERPYIDQLVNGEVVRPVRAHVQATDKPAERKRPVANKNIQEATRQNTSGKQQDSKGIVIPAASEAALKHDDKQTVSEQPALEQETVSAAQQNNQEYNNESITQEDIFDIFDEGTSFIKNY